MFSLMERLPLSCTEKLYRLEVSWQKFLVRNRWLKVLIIRSLPCTILLFGKMNLQITFVTGIITLNFLFRIVNSCLTNTSQILQLFFPSFALFKNPLKTVQARFSLTQQYHYESAPSLLYVSASRTKGLRIRLSWDSNIHFNLICYI